MKNLNLPGRDEQTSQQVHRSIGPVQGDYGKEYFAKYLKRNRLGIATGSRPFLYAFWLRYLARFCPAHASILEVGCGIGFFVVRLNRKFPTVGLDISLSALEFARRHWGITSLVCGTAESLPFASANFDVIFALDVVEHLKDPQRFLGEAQRLLTDDGLMVVSTPNPESLGARRKGDDWFAYRDETHVSIHEIREWRLAFMEAGFAIEKDGTDFLWDPPYVGWIPSGLQRAACISSQWLMTWALGFLAWKMGENYIAILRKRSRPLGAAAVSPQGT